MPGDDEAVLRRAMILTLAACRTLTEQLNDDVLEQLALGVRVQELADLLESDLNRYERSV